MCLIRIQCEIKQLESEQTASTKSRTAAVGEEYHQRKLYALDSAADLYLTPIRAHGLNKKPIKIGSSISEICQTPKTSLPIAIKGQKLLFYCCPSVVLSDKKLLPRTIKTIDIMLSIVLSIGRGARTTAAFPWAWYCLHN
ncbi:hypothetical protein Ciccas_002373 [Cichlidogyrus casuarinus]|uniref:IFT80 second beta-propeller domain-containing protein n=1 Tax=Cichlidogyrus casuarinus TaxID=1844966 RepID=A0ABD2QHS0_9PLAT